MKCAKECQSAPARFQDVVPLQCQRKALMRRKQRAATISISNSKLKKMIKYILKQCKNSLSKIYGKWFAYPQIDETLNLDDLSKHMASHNSPYSEGVIHGVLKDMVKCIKEQLLEGKNVKIDDLAIFSVGIKNKSGGSLTEDEFSLSKNISGVKLRARATGELSNKSLNLEATLKRATTAPANGEGSSSTPSGGSNSGSSSGSNTGGNSGSTGSGGFEEGE